MMVNWRSVQYKHKAKFGVAEAGLCLHDLGGKVIKQPNTSQLITFGMHQLYLLSGIPVTGFRWPQSFYDYYFSLSHPHVILVLSVLSPSMFGLLCSDFSFCLTFSPVFSPSSFNLSLSLRPQTAPPISAHFCPSGLSPSFSPRWPCHRPAPSVCLALLYPDASNHCPFHTILYIKASSLSLSLPSLSDSNRVFCMRAPLGLSLPRTLPLHRCQAWFATAVSPCATTKCCLQLQGRVGVGGGGGGSGVEGAEWISHEYSCPFGCTTKHESGTIEKTPALKKPSGWVRIEGERKEETGRKDRWWENMWISDSLTIIWTCAVHPGGHSEL